MSGGGGWRVAEWLCGFTFFSWRINNIQLSSGVTASVLQPATGGHQWQRYLCLLIVWGLQTFLCTDSSSRACAFVHPEAMSRQLVCYVSSSSAIPSVNGNLEPAARASSSS